MARKKPMRLREWVPTHKVPDVTAKDPYYYDGWSWRSEDVREEVKESLVKAGYPESEFINICAMLVHRPPKNEVYGVALDPKTGKCYRDPYLADVYKFTFHAERKRKKT